MSKRNSKSSNASSVVVVRCTAVKMGAFFSSCSKLCNEWSLMSVRRAEAELRWFKRNRENTGTMRESTGTGHTAGDHVLVTAILCAIFIVALVYLLVLGQPFRFRRLERAGTPSSTATSASWVHGPSKTRLLPGFLSTVRYNAGSNNTVADSAATGDATPEGVVRCEILEHSRTHEPVFRCSMDPEYNGNTFLALGSSASAATQKFFQNIGLHLARSKSGPEFFGYSKKDVQRSLVEAGKAQHVDGQFVIDLDDSELEKMSSTTGGSKQNVVVTWGGLMCPGTPLQNAVGDRWWVTVGKEKVQWRPGYHARRIIKQENRNTVSIDCKVHQQHSFDLPYPVFRLEYHGEGITSGIIESDNPGAAMKELFRRLQVIFSHMHCMVMTVTF